MADRASELRLVEAAKEHFDNIPAPEIEDPHDRDSLMYQYSVARDAVSFFTKQRDKLLKELLDSDDLLEEVNHLVEYVEESDMGTEKLLETGDYYNLHLKLSAPPKQFKKEKLPEVLQLVFNAAPSDVRQVMKKCETKGTPRKTFTIAQKEHME